MYALEREFPKGQWPFVITISLRNEQAITLFSAHDQYAPLPGNDPDQSVGTHRPAAQARNWATFSPISTDSGRVAGISARM